MSDGPFLEDFKVGDVSRSSSGRTITQADNIWFSLLTNNQNPIHIDAHYASQTEFKRPLVTGVQTCALPIYAVHERTLELGLRSVVGVDVDGVLVVGEKGEPDVVGLRDGAAG